MRFSLFERRCVFCNGSKEKMYVLGNKDICDQCLDNLTSLVEHQTAIRKKSPSADYVVFERTR